MRKLATILSIFLACCIATDTMAQRIDYKATTYRLFIDGKVRQWGVIIDKMENDPEKQSDISKIELLGYYYGYIGHLLDIKNKDAATIEIKKAQKLITGLSAKYPHNTLLMGYSANITGYQIAIAPLKATTLARGMMHNTRNAIAKSPNDPVINILTANIFFYMPNMFGGDSNMALKQYYKALNMFEENETLRKDNWMYLQLLVTTGIVEEKQGNYENAKKLYLKILNIYPDYSQIRDNRYPNLLKKMAS
ncbi:MAG: hypothetical protein RR293_02055 [Bacteroidales bacterium]